MTVKEKIHRNEEATVELSEYIYAKYSCFEIWGFA